MAELAEQAELSGQGSVSGGKVAKLVGVSGRSKHAKKGTDTEGHRARLRQRFERSGFVGFADYEVLELILTLCIPRKDVKPIAKVLIGRFGSLREVMDAPRSALLEVYGMGEVAVTALRIMRETCSLYLQQTAEVRVELNNLSALERFWQSRLGHLSYEVFEVAYLDKHYRLIPDGIERLAQGDTDQVPVYIKQLIRMALQHGAHAIVVAHNHPAGRAQPSQSDIALTQSIQHASKLVDLKLIDHIIVTPKSGTYSFRKDLMLTNA